MELLSSPLCPRRSPPAGPPTAVMSPLQMSVYWRLSLVFFFTSFLFFLDIFTAAIVAATCHLGNNTGVSVRRGALEGNQSLPGQDEADWMTESGIGDVSDGHHV